ncbi:MAG: hypothetical protein ABIH49_01470 [archaeon]
MNRKGFLLGEETLKIVIAVIALVFLIYFLTSLYFTNLNAEKIKQAKADVERIVENADSLAEGESATQVLPNPEGWYLFGFTGEIKPNSCFGESCICVCDRVFDNPIRNLFSKWEERQSVQCLKNGACANVENLEPFDEIKIAKTKDKLTTISIKKESGIFISEEK